MIINYKEYDMSIERKLSHIENYLKSCNVGEPLYDDIFIEHNALPEIAIDEVDTSCEFLNRKTAFPLMINAMTGGPKEAYQINQDLAKICKKHCLPMAVGSQSVALGDAIQEVKDSFRVARDVLGDDGLLIGNISARVSFEHVKEAIELIDADAIQVHLNFLHELVMDEGDRDFRGVLKNIEDIVEKSPVPVIVKEVGFGLSSSVVRSLVNVGVKYVDIAGTGGTNFIEIEDLRSNQYHFDEMYCYGNPAAYALISARRVNPNVFMIGSGGIKTELDIVKSLVMGADYTAISGEILSYLLYGSYNSADEYIGSLIYKTKVLMCALGKSTIKDLRSVNYKITGKLRELLNG